ncbi:MAG: dTMP kinase [Parcubacteria group bacterium Gr01-1014_18]|nr:MAG: dTMP kinase [Parcubacteria group bacterium Greene0416_36]TSC79783.1 MAG: dTMP kinase [Parcubacteria group bacterium Gr01-1014_18]TSC98067.1 MAG: dTMP kinase [Parcubacteria group bacterium Greene1014_20]TSD06502.1 MAG: dTMP kinase [Parcubacteria group bacterium Greene0714_2]
MPGKLIVIDGSDGVGKKTQTQLLLQKLTLKKIPVQTISFPRYSEDSSAPIRMYLAGDFGSPEKVGPKLASILFAMDRFAALGDIKKWLAEGKTVISDRYTSSNMGHQGSLIQNQEERKKFFLWLYDLEHRLLGIPKPDLTLILHCPAQMSQRLIHKRGKQKDMLEQDITLQERSAAIFYEIATTLPSYTLVECTNAKRELKSIEEIHLEIHQLVRNLAIKQ